MKRDMDLIRTILIETERHATPHGFVNLTLTAYSPEEVAYHVKLLDDAGLIEAQNLSTMHGIDWKPKSLTWEGHEFLDAAKNDTVWNKTKELVKQKGGGVSFEVLKSLLVKGTLALFGA